MNAPIPNQPEQANPQHRIFAEIIADFKTYHTTGNDTFKGRFTLDDKLFKLSDVFALWDTVAYQNKVVDQARKDITKKLRQQLKHYKEIKHPLLPKFQKRWLSWQQYCPEWQEWAIFDEHVWRIMIRNCMQRHKPTGTQTPENCEFINQIKLHLAKVAM